MSRKNDVRALVIDMCAAQLGWPNIPVSCIYILGKPRDDAFQLTGHSYSDFLE